MTQRREPPMYGCGLSIFLIWGGSSPLSLVFFGTCLHEFIVCEGSTAPFLYQIDSDMNPLQTGYPEGYAWTTLTYLNCGTNWKIGTLNIKKIFLLRPNPPFVGQLEVASRDGPWWCCCCVGPVSTSTARGARVVLVACKRVNEGVRMEPSLALIDML